MNQSVRPRKLALLTPYDGGNLGDSAIQEALITNLRRHNPEIELCGITLNPVRTAVRHGIPCYPITANSVSHYQVTTQPRENLETEGTIARQEDILTLHRRLRRLARRVFFLVWIKVFVQEILHFIRGYRLLRNVSALVIAGGGQLDDEWGGSWGHPYALMKWSLMATAAGCSVFFLSVGACRLESRLTRFFLRVALSTACYRSYRDEESRRLALAITPRAQGSIAPDLAFSLPATVQDPLGRANGALLCVGVSPIAYGHLQLWPTPNASQYERYLTELARFVTELLQSGISVTLFSSSPPDDQIFEDLRRRIGDTEMKNHSQLSVQSPNSVSELLELLRSFDVVVASRLHGVLLSLLAGTPTVAVSYDRKVKRLMEDLRLAEYCAEIGTFTSDTLHRMFSSLGANRNAVLSSVAASCSQYDHLLQQQFAAVTELAEGSKAPIAQSRDHALSSRNS